MPATTAILQTSDLKNRTGKILDAARRRPQYVVRDGQLFQITVAEIPLQPRNRPAGYFTEEPDPERQAIEAAFSRQRQTIDR